MYQQIYYDRNSNTVHLWDDVDGYSNFPYQNYGFSYNPNGEYITMDGVKVDKTFNLKRGKVYETDVPPTTRVLIDKYLDDDNPSREVRKLIFDIEVEMISGTPDVRVADNTITSIAIYDYVSDDRYVLVLNESDRKIDDMTNINLEVFSSEKELLRRFIYLFQEINPHIVTYWNGDDFDMPYMYHRINKILGENWTSKLSPIGIVRCKKSTNVITIGGVSLMDYIHLYKQYTYHELPNYTLDYVSRTEIGEGKIEYDGNLDDLFNTDINKFIKYNLVDVELIKKLEEKLKYIELSRAICHTSHISYQDYIHSSSVIEGAILTYLRREKTVALNKPTKFDFKVNGNHKKGSRTLNVKLNVPENKIPSSCTFKIKTSKASKIECKYNKVINNQQFILDSPLPKDVSHLSEINLSYVGAFVKEPKPGLYDWLYSIDLQSLYPSIIMSLNISPETKMGKILNWKDINFMNYIDLENGELSCSINQLFSYIDGDQDIVIEELSKDITVYDKDTFIEIFGDFAFRISTNGIIYHGDKKGIIPKILEDWFDKRLIYKDEKKKATTEEDKEFYDKRQLVQKILLNSTYGVLGLSSFRFFDLDNASAITETGQSILKFSEFMINKYYQKTSKSNKYKDLAVYEDTDSVVSDSTVYHKGEYIAIESLFNKLKLNSEYYIDNFKREYVVPNAVKMPYFDEDSFKVKLGIVEFIERHKVKKRHFKIYTEDNHITVTEDHSIMVISDGKLIEKKPMELTEDDKIIEIL